ncbi:MAG: tetratricopeptide repeat protein [Chloroflexaceae bacterium]|nr:tetratricopeptide repeat protein [Chloroflexaceae bacterium]
MDTIQQQLTQLGFTQTHTVRGKARIDALFPEKKRCGIYVLHFPDQTYYVGQAKDVCKRYVQHHSKAFPDIEQISFKSVAQAKLDAEEEYIIKWLEANGVRLRNITHTSIPATSSELDLLIAPTKQERWLHDLSLADAGDARADIPAAQYDKTNAKYRQFEQDIPRARKTEALQLLRYYIHQCVPAYRRTEYDYWSLSCMPVTNGKRLATLNMSKMEMLVIFPNGHLFVIVAFSEIHKAYPTNADFHRTYQHAYLTFSRYEDAGVDQCHIRIGSFAEAWRVLADPAVQRGIRLINLYRMRKRGSFYKQSHCPALVDAIYAVPVPDVQQHAKPPRPAEDQTLEVAQTHLHYGQQFIEYKQLINFGDYESAQIVLERALNIFQKHIPSSEALVAETAFHLGRVHQDLHDYPRAIEYYTQATQLSPNEAAPYNNRGNAYSDQGDYTRAIQDYTHAIQLEPHNTAAYTNRGHTYAGQGDYARAIEDYNKAIALDPDDSRAYLIRGHTYAEQGDYARAIQDYDQAIVLDPNDAIVHNTRGLAYYTQGDYARAIADYTRAIELDPHNTAAYTNRGNVYYAQGQYTRAVQDFDRAIQLDPQNAAAYNNRGNCYDKQGNYARAIADFDRAMQIHSDASYYRNRGISYYDQGDYDRAFQDFGHAIQIDPTDVDSYYNRGLVYYRQGEYARSVQDLNRVIALDPEYINAYIVRGAAYHKQGDYAHAIQDFDQAIALDPNSSGSYNNRGVTYTEQGDYARAIADCTQAIALDPNQSEAYHSRGFAYAAHGNTPEAIADLERFIGMSDDAELIAEAQEKLGELRP